MATLTCTVPFATIVFEFDPLLRIGDSTVRYETLGLAGAALLGILLAAILAGRTASPHPRGAVPVLHPADAHLRRDDLLFIVLGIVPGAVIGGRIGYVLLHIDFYTANPSAILDPSQGSLELGLAVVGGMLTGAYVARLLDAPVGRWFHVAAVPVFLAIALGEGARILGGSGQGSPSAAAWSTAYLGPGPWGSLGPAIPSDPSQAYGAIAAALAFIAVGIVIWLGGFGGASGSAFFVALLIWAIGRVVVTTTWRDQSVLGPLPVGGIIAIGVAVAAVAGLWLARWSAGRARFQAHEGPPPASGPAWADPDDRPRF
jgi:phosphatidylglycerol---prolipoprotein diacylglyceryl transferase